MVHFCRHSSIRVIRGFKFKCIYPPCFNTLTLPYPGPDFSIRGLLRLKVQPSLRFCHSYNDVLCLIFSPDCPPTTRDGDLYNEAKEALLNFTVSFILVITGFELIICTLNESIILNSTYPVPSSLYYFLYTPQMQETFPG